MEWWSAGLVVITLLVLVLVFPWKSEFRLCTGGQISFKIKFMNRLQVLAFRIDSPGQVRITLMGCGFNLKVRQKSKDKGKGTGYPKKAGDGFLPFRARAALRAATTGTAVELVRYFRGMIGDAKTRLEISGDIGLGDPAATGMVFGMVYGLAGACGCGKVNLRPDFLNPVLEGDIRVSLSAVPLVVLGRTLKTFFHPDIRKVWLTMIAPGGSFITKGTEYEGTNLRGGV